MSSPFDLDQALADWRRRMAAAGVETPEVLDEVESHLREEIRRLMLAGKPGREAFSLAVSGLGATESLTAEFRKISRMSPGPRLIPALLCTGIIFSAAVALLAGFSVVRPSALLLAHIVTLTAGYAAAFAAGGVGLYYVCGQRFKELMPTRQPALRRGATLLNQLSACLVLAGLLLGMLWSGRNRGRYLSGDPREIGTLCASLWLVLLWVIERFGRLSTNAIMLLCIVSNMIISLAWFGAGLMAHGYGIGSHWPLNTALGVSLFFLTLGVLPRFASLKT